MLPFYPAFFDYYSCFSHLWPYPSTYLAIYLSCIYICIRPSTNPSARPPIHPSIHPSTNPTKQSIQYYSFTHPSITTPVPSSRFLWGSHMTSPSALHGFSVTIRPFICFPEACPMLPLIVPQELNKLFPCFILPRWLPKPIQGIRRATGPQHVRSQAPFTVLGSWSFG